MKPNTPEILDSIIWSLKSYVEPEVQSPFGRSVMATVENLLRHVKLRAESEGEILLADCRDLEQVMARLLSRFEAHEALSAALGAEVPRLREALESGAVKGDVASSVAVVSARSLALRQALDELLKALGGVRQRFADDQVYQDSRQEIRGYLARQLEREGQLITPAFIGGRR